MRYIRNKYFQCNFVIITCLVCCISSRLSGQWSFKPNYYQYNASVLGTNTVYRLLEDPYGFIWMVSDKGILIFNGKSFTTIKIPGNEQEIVSICRYENTLYATTFTGRLYTINMLTLAAKEIALPAAVINESTPFTIMNTINDKLYLAKNIGAFLILDLKNEHKLILESSSDYFFRYILYGDLGTTITNTPLDSSLNKYRVKVTGNKIYVKDAIYEIWNRQLKTFYTTGKENQKLKTVYSYLQDNNDLYVGFLQSGGLVKYNNYNSNSHFNKSHSILPNVEVGEILKDRNGNIWVSTLHDGVFIFLKDGENIKKISSKHKFYSNDVWYVKYKNKVLNIGYKQLIVDQFKNGTFYKRWIGDTTVNFNPVALFHNYRDKTIIFGVSSTYFNSIVNPPGILSAAFKDQYFHNGKLYASTPGGFINLSEKLNLAFHTKGILKFSSIFILPDSNLLYGGPTGLYLNHTPTKIKDRVTKVRAYNKDILACSDNGLYIKRGERYFHITEKQGLLDNQCIQIEYYGDKYYKLLTKTGLAYIDTGTCAVAGVLNSQSLGNNTVIHNFDVENDTIWLATDKGIYALNEQFLLTQDKNSILAYLYPEKLNNRSLRYTQKHFETQYNNTKLVKMLVEVLDFSPKEYSISYQVENNSIITEKSQVINNSFVVTTPEPGNYTIKVFVSRGRGYIDKTLTYLLKITPLWYQTSWARLLFTLSIVIVLWFTIRFTIRYIIKEKEKRLKEKYAILQLQSQAFFTQLNPHFIFNALTPLQSHILKNEKIESLEYLDRFSSLMRDILKNSDKIETDLEKELDFIKKYVTIQQIRFSPCFVFKLHVHPFIDPENISIPAMMFQPIIENAIEHGVKNMGASGKITVDIAPAIVSGKDCIQIYISDNGPGVTENILKEGHALYILQKRIQTLQKKDGIIASLTHEAGQNGIGTTFKLLLPKTKTLWTP
jgi:hypothetical protein